MVIIGLLCSEVTLLASRRCICWWLTTILKLLPLTLYLHLSNRGTLTECEKPVFWKNYMTLYRQFYIDNFVQVCYVVLRCLFLTLNKTFALLQLASTSSERKRLKMAFIEVRRKNDFILPGSMRFVYFCLQIHATQHKVLNHLITTRSFSWILNC